MMEVWPSAEIAGLAEWIASRTGLTFPPSRRQIAAAALEKALRGGSRESLETRLEADPAALDELLAELTIGESYFFRHPEQIAVVRNEILPSLAHRERAIRLWSAGCATGEEAYTLAIIAGEAVPGTESEIVGTDLSRARLAAARHGRYRAWSMRGVPETVIRQYFRQDGPWYHIAPELRARTEFRYLNLVDDEYPSRSSRVWGMDVILCRNVLIYLDRESIGRAARKLFASLSPDGWLLLGASDPPIDEWLECEVLITAAGLAYRRPAAAAPALPLLRRAANPAVERELRPEVDPPAPPPARKPAIHPPQAPASALVSSSELTQLYAERRYDEVVLGAAALLALGDREVEVEVLLVRALANQGRLEEAGRACAAALDRHRGAAELLYLHALLLSTAGLPRESADAARRAIYMDRGLVVAHLALGDALGRAGDKGGMRRSLRNAVELLSRCPPDEMVPASEGELAGGLLRRTEMRLQLLDKTQ